MLYVKAAMISLFHEVNSRFYQTNDKFLFQEKDYNEQTFEKKTLCRY